MIKDECLEEAAEAPSFLVVNEFDFAFVVKKLCAENPRLRVRAYLLVYSSNYSFIGLSIDLHVCLFVQMVVYSFIRYVKHLKQVEFWIFGTSLLGGGGPSRCFMFNGGSNSHFGTKRLVGEKGVLIVFLSCSFTGSFVLLDIRKETFVFVLCFYLLNVTKLVCTLIH